MRQRGDGAAMAPDWAVTSFTPPSRRGNAIENSIPDSKVHGANMGPIWGQQDPGGSHVGPMNLVI